MGRTVTTGRSSIGAAEAMVVSCPVYKPFVALLLEGKGGCAGLGGQAIMWSKWRNAHAAA
jgi:hypothetical protein